MSDTEVEIVPLTNAQTAAIRKLRFVWTNLEHSVAWGLTNDQTVAESCPGGVTPVTRSRNPKPLIEYDVMMGHPHAVALVAEIQAERVKNGTSFPLRKVA